MAWESAGLRIREYTSFVREPEEGQEILVVADNLEGGSEHDRWLPSRLSGCD